MPIAEYKRLEDKDLKQATDCRELDRNRLRICTARSSSGAGRMMTGAYRNGHGDGCCDNRGQHEGMT